MLLSGGRPVAFVWRRTAKPISLDADTRAVCEHRGTECQVRLSGRITIDSSPGLRLLLLRRLEGPSCQILTVDFHDVAYVDTSGLAMLVEVLRSARTQGKAFHLSGLRERPRYLLEATGLLHFFDEVHSEQPAVNLSSPESLL
jgi:anti-sigma B factor antagonist